MRQHDLCLYEQPENLVYIRRFGHIKYHQLTLAHYSDLIPFYLIIRKTSANKFRTMKVLKFFEYFISNLNLEL